MFLLPLLLLRGRRWLDRFDLGVVAGVRRLLRAVRHAHLEPAVWVFYPPLIYLLVRMLIRGFEAALRPAPARLPSAHGRCSRSACCAGGRADRDDAAPAGVDRRRHRLGARRVQDPARQSLYYYSLGHGDTYGPINYLAYAPFELLWPGSWDYLPAARAATITFDLLTIGGLILLGSASAPGPRRVAPRAAARMAVGRVPVHACSAWRRARNDGLVALIVVLIMLALTKPIKRGRAGRTGRRVEVLPGDPAATGRGRTRRRRPANGPKVLAAFVITAGASFAVFLPPGGADRRSGTTRSATS